jgi:hypothetical protein
MLWETRRDGYGNRVINHSERIFVTKLVAKKLEDILIAIDNLTVFIISNSHPNSNLPDETLLVETLDLERRGELPNLHVTIDISHQLRNRKRLNAYSISGASEIDKSSPHA